MAERFSRRQAPVRSADDHVDQRVAGGVDGRAFVTVLWVRAMNEVEEVRIMS